LLAMVMLAFIFRMGVSEKAGGPVALRHLPEHTVADQPFPVVIEVGLPEQAESSLLVKEVLPQGCRLLRSVPQATVVEGQTLKWIVKEGRGKNRFAYLAAFDGQGGRGGEFPGPGVSCCWCGPPFVRRAFESNILTGLSK
jgi:hypothetical protein